MPTTTVMDLYVITYERMMERRTISCGRGDEVSTRDARSGGSHLEGGQQAMIALPLLSVVLFFAHIGPLHQPVGRAIGYGIFWAIPATWAIVHASQNERRKRAKREADDDSV